ncbi:hypothetical protein BGZ60DRAFT_532622 [Tricladium varicosporioides]|nr:hypothetical protein BGZ60DRAFT_532622 [Hymenoscyphus varicosporioides]
MYRYTLPKKSKRVRPSRDDGEDLKEKSSTTDSNGGAGLTEGSFHHPSSHGYAHSAKVEAVSRASQRPAQRSLSNPDVYAGSEESHVKHIVGSRATFRGNNASQYGLGHPGHRPTEKSPKNVDHGPGKDLPDYENPRYRSSVDTYRQSAGFGVLNGDDMPSNDQSLPRPPNHPATDAYDNPPSKISEYDRRPRVSQLQIGSSIDTINRQDRDHRQLHGSIKCVEQPAGMTRMIQPSTPHVVDRNPIPPRTSMVRSESTRMTSEMPNYGDGNTSLSPGHEDHRIPVCWPGYLSNSANYHPHQCEYAEQNVNIIDHNVRNTQSEPQSYLAQQGRVQDSRRHYPTGDGFAGNSWSNDSKMTTTSSMERTSTKPVNVEYNSALHAEDDRVNKSLGKQPETKNRYVDFVMVWQDALNKSGHPSRLDNRRLMIDTQCQNSNWVSKSIVDALGAETWILEHPKVFIAFNGAKVTPYLETTLSFAHMEYGTTKTAKFFVATTPNAPFDMVLGAESIKEFDILGSPTFGLHHIKQSKEALKVEANRVAEHNKQRLEQEKKNRQRKEGKNKKGKSKRNEEPTKPKPEDRRDSGYE